MNIYLHYLLKFAVFLHFFQFHRIYISSERHWIGSIFSIIENRLYVLSGNSSLKLNPSNEEY